MKQAHNSWIKLKGYLNREDYDAIHRLQLQCNEAEPVALKLELDYKLEDAENTPDIGIQDINEFLYYTGEQLIGYMGICGFGDSSEPLEITGMVHPAYRRQGIFSRLHQLVAAECERRHAASRLLLCDRNSASGQAFLQTKGAVYQSSEYEMFLQRNAYTFDEDRLCGLRFRKASNADADEIARQNRIYFGDTGNDEPASDPRLPEEEEARGMPIYLAYRDDQLVGKVNLQLINGVGGIYGLGVLPDFRGRGYGRAILLKSVQMLLDQKAKDVMLQVAAHNETALGLYKSCGFRETSVMDYFKC